MTEIKRRPTSTLGATEEYELVIHSIMDLVQETKFNIREQLIAMKYQVGRIIGESSFYQRNQHGAGKIISRIATDLDTNTRDIYDCIQFYFRCYDYDVRQIGEHDNHHSWVNSLEGVGKHISWSWIRQRLPEGKEAPPAPIKKRKPQVNKLLQYGEDRVGQVWSSEDQERLIFLLGVTEADPDEISPTAAVQRAGEEEWQ